MKTQKIIVTLLVLFITPVLLADYVISRTDKNILARYKDDGTTLVWEMPYTVSDPVVIRTSPSNLDLYTAAGASRNLRRIDRQTGEILETSAAGARTDDMTFGYDYNGDGVPDIWATQSHNDATGDPFTVWDGAEPLSTSPLAIIKIPDSDGVLWDGSGGRSIMFGPDLTGDGIQEMYVVSGLNDNSNKINIWNPVALSNGQGVAARIASYSASKAKETEGIILGPDFNGDGRKDLWIADQRESDIEVYDYMTGAYLGNAFNDPSSYNPQDIKNGPRGTVLVSTRFATSLDPHWVSGTLNGGNVVQYDPATQEWSLVWEAPSHASSDRIWAVEYLPSNAYNPDPEDGATRVPAATTTLSWNNPEGALKCDLYFGTDPNARDGGTKVTITDPDVRTTVGIPAASLPLTDQTDYYWLVDCYSGIVEDPNDPNTITLPDNPNLPGDVWTFHTNFNLAPVVDVPDQYLWQGQDGVPGQATLAFTPVVSDDGLPDGSSLIYEWTQLAGPAVTIDPANVKDISVVLTELSNDYQFQLTVSDGDLTTTVQPIVVLATDACAASAQKPGFTYSLGDINQDCIVDMADLIEMASNWLGCTSLGGCN